MTTGFIQSCVHAHEDLVSLLLTDLRIDVNAGDEFGNTAFFWACTLGHCQIISLLLQDRRVDVNKENKHGETGFLSACRNNHVDTVSLLLKDSRINVNKTDTYGNRGFHYAIEKRYNRIVALLLQDSRLIHSDRFIAACCPGDLHYVPTLLTPLSYTVNQGEKHDQRIGVISACKSRRADNIWLLQRDGRMVENSREKRSDGEYITARVNEERERLARMSAVENMESGWMERVERLCKALTSAPLSFLSKRLSRR